MLKGTTVLLNNGMLDVELLEVYITEHLGGVIGEDYAASQGRIRIGKEAPAVTTTTTIATTTTAVVTTTTATSAESPKTGEEDVTALWVTVLLAGVCIVLTAHTVRARNR